MGIARVEGGGGIDPALPGMALGWVEAAMVVEKAWHYEDAGVVELKSEWREDAGMKSRMRRRGRTGESRSVDPDY